MRLFDSTRRRVQLAADGSAQFVTLRQLATRLRPVQLPNHYLDPSNVDDAGGVIAVRSMPPRRTMYSNRLTTGKAERDQITI